MKALILVSGGIDSSTCLAMAVEKYGADECLALAVNYGQRHERELESAREIASFYGCEFVNIDLTDIFRYSDSSLLFHSDQEVPEESYEVQLARAQGHPVSTYVPFRNGLFISVAASMALSYGCCEIYYGAHKNDVEGSAYPDCSQIFFDSMSAAVYEGSGRELKLLAPFIDMRKGDIVREGLKLGVPYELTWSCYEGGEAPCGKCGTCLDRARAFEENGVEDPLLQEE